MRTPDVSTWAQDGPIVSWLPMGSSRVIGGHRGPTDAHAWHMLALSVWYCIILFMVFFEAVLLRGSI